ncbi:MAG: hypothetical protein IT423_00865 [Pirellulaceae bacterium]|nr:hypothetical protein [Pirellulaceae bacterium]
MNQAPSHIVALVIALLTTPLFHLQAAEPLRLAVFRADVTPPLGSPLCGGLVKPTEAVSDPLQALGVVLLSEDKPIVLCAVDYCEIRGADHVHWREVLAKAAGTSPERVAVHALHQHNVPLADSVAQQLLPEIPIIDTKAAERTLTSVAASLEAALKHPQPVTHFTTGQAQVHQVASNRRVMGPDGKVIGVRTSATKDVKLREAPEGTIDPMLKTISFWNENQKLAALHYYATHPMSYYGDGVVSSDFVGIAREQRTVEESVPHIFFTGCGGNVTAGKYNDGSKENRARLADRIHSAMVQSEQQPKRAKLDHWQWHVKPVLFNADPNFSEQRMLQLIGNPATSNSVRIGAAMRVAFIRQCAAGVPIPFTSLHLNDDVCLLHLPGEAFIEYQLFAQQQFSSGFVATASYGDGGPGYIPLEHSFVEGGYEPTWAFAAPDSEKLMRQTITDLLQKP